MCEATLTEWEREQVDHFKAYNVPASWFVGKRSDKGLIEVIALGDGFAWSFLLDPVTEEVHTSEAKVSDFSTGLEI